LREETIIRKRRPLDLDEILNCVDLYRDVTGSFPTKHSGPVADMLGETWLAIDSALRYGNRGLPRLGSLSQLLVLTRCRPICGVIRGKLSSNSDPARREQRARL